MKGDANAAVGVVGACARGVGGGKHPASERRQPMAMAVRTLFFATSSLVASVASYVRGMSESRRQWPASVIWSAGKSICRIAVV